MQKKKSTLKKLINFLLIYFTFFIIFFNSTTSSKYTGKIDALATTNVANWEVSLDTNNSNEILEIISGNTTQNYTLKVISTSDVAINYSVILSNLPDGIKVSIDNKEFSTPENNTITFKNVGEFDANSTNTTREHILTFDAPLDSKAVGINEIKLDVRCDQIN